MINNNITIELRGAPLPKPLNKIAIHLYFVIHTPNNSNKFERWELWQSKNAFNASKALPIIEKQNVYFGHIHKNLKGPKEGVGGGPSFHLKKWKGLDALRIKESIERQNETYLYRNYYLPWPGPNSNTYISYILEDSQINYTLPKTAIGKDWRGLVHFKKGRALKFQLFTFGFHYKPKTSWEIHLLGFTIRRDQ